MEHLKAQLSYFAEITEVSGKLYPIAKARPQPSCWIANRLCYFAKTETPGSPQEERKQAAVSLLRSIALPREDLFMPTNSHLRVRGAIAESAAPMQVCALP